MLQLRWPICPRPGKKSVEKKIKNCPEINLFKCSSVDRNIVDRNARSLRNENSFAKVKLSLEMSMRQLVLTECEFAPFFACPFMHLSDNRKNGS